MVVDVLSFTTTLTVAADRGVMVFPYRWRDESAAGGERWPDGSLRPAVEDQWGAGSFIDLLRTAGWQGASPEADAAADTFRAATRDLTDALANCASGRELIALGYHDDVHTAAELDGGTAVPLLRKDAFVSA